MLVKCEQNRMVQTARNFELFDKKNVFFKTHFWQSVDAILEDVFVVETIVLKGPYADHILIPQGSTGSSIFFFISNESPYISDCKSKTSASNYL